MGLAATGTARSTCPCWSRPRPARRTSRLGPAGDGYDPNIDIVCAAIYGAVPVTDPKLLATAAALRRQWEDPTSPAWYPVNGTDKALGLGPLLGRYPGDHYDGDVAHPSPAATRGRCAPPISPNCTTASPTRSFATKACRPTRWRSRSSRRSASPTAQARTTPQRAALRAAGDAMLRAIIYHSDHLELSEQFDGTSGYERSVRNLTWSYAAFLSAVRARAGKIV